MWLAVQHTTPVPKVLPLHRKLELLLPRQAGEDRALAVHACAMEEGKQAASERESF